MSEIRDGIRAALQEPSSVDSLAPLVAELRSLADCDSRAGEPLGKCMRKAADKIERMAEHSDYIEAQWLAKDVALKDQALLLAEARREADSFRALATGLQLERDQLSASRDKLLAEIARLAAEGGKLETTLVAAAIDAKRAQRERDEALEALKPFARYIAGREERLGYREADDERMLREVTIGDFRRASSVLESRSSGLADATPKSNPRGQ